MIDLHMHTTASDGRLTPAELVSRAARVGITIMSVTDHDTVAGLSEVRRAAEASSLTVVDGIEITAVHDGRDIHILGYFLDVADTRLASFLEAQRRRRVERIQEIGGRLQALGVAVDVGALLTSAAHVPGTSVGRPAIARALVAAGHVGSAQEAFDRYLAAGRPAFVPRIGPSPLDVLQIIQAARGIASLAHPGVTRKPEVLESLVSAGLDAIEVHHSDHPPELRQELHMFAARHGLLETGGSDFHGDEDRKRPLGAVTLPAAAFARLEAAARTRRAH
jgi:predicted metal-dependent phosphoesterase TrpH